MLIPSHPSLLHLISYYSYLHSYSDIVMEKQLVTDNKICHY